MDVEQLDVRDLRFYARLCGWTLARAHARSGDPVAISGYLGSGRVFDDAIVHFSEQYAEQNRIDHERFVERIESGELEAEEG